MWNPLSSLARRVRRALGRPDDPIDARNRRYDAQTLAVMQRVLQRRSNGIDVGCHEGSMLRALLRRAPAGTHHAFEPLPDFATRLRARFGRRPNVHLHELALADTAGTATFQHVVSNPGYSGLLRRRYDRPDETLTEITVRTARLDDIVPVTQAVDFVKIDVEGAELGVLRGGIATLRRTRPTIVFEHGPGGSDCYGTRPEHVHDLLVGECGLRIYVMADWLARGEGSALDRAALARHFDQGLDYYYMARP